MSFDAWIVAFGISTLLRELAVIAGLAAYSVLLAVVAVDGVMLYRFFARGSGVPGFRGSGVLGSGVPGSEVLGSGVPGSGVQAPPAVSEPRERSAASSDPP
jgi:hypothetical protein